MLHSMFLQETDIAIEEEVDSLEGVHSIVEAVIVQLNRKTIH